MSNTMKLGVNIDHIATLREARAINDPNPLEAVFVAKNAGADQITLHLREDRRHIHDDDVKIIVHTSPLPINIESALDEQIVDYLCSLAPIASRSCQKNAKRLLQKVAWI